MTVGIASVIAAKCLHPTGLNHQRAVCIAHCRAYARVAPTASNTIYMVRLRCSLHRLIDLRHQRLGFSPEQPAMPTRQSRRGSPYASGKDGERLITIFSSYPPHGQFISADPPFAIVRSYRERSSGTVDRAFTGCRADHRRQCPSLSSGVSAPFSTALSPWVSIEACTACRRCLFRA